MPRGDGTGPPGGGGSGTGKRGGGKFWGGTGQGKMGGTRPGAGPQGYCVCPSCGARVPHQAGAMCSDLSCPNCGARMVRE